jgi:hypothetical protein
MRSVLQRQRDRAGLSGGFTITTQAMHVGNYSDLKTCMAAAKDSQGSGSLDNWRSNYLCVQASDGKVPPP